MDKKQQVIGILCLAGLLLLTGIVLMVTKTQAQPGSTGVKQQTIPLSASDYADDPRLQAAIQNQLQSQQGSPQTTKTQDANTQDSQLLQPVPTGIPTE